MTRARTPRPHEIDDARRDERLLRALREGGTEPAWRTRGLCQNVDPELFFPAPTEPVDAAVELCRTCPVLGSCLAWALRAGDLHGVWGGTTARERRAMAVVWRAWQHQGRPAAARSEPAVRPGAGPDGRRPDPVPVQPARREPAARPASPQPQPSAVAVGEAGQGPVGPVVDRAELLRLVRAT